MGKLLTSKNLLGRNVRLAIKRLGREILCAKKTFVRKHARTLVMKWYTFLFTKAAAVDTAFSVMRRHIIKCAVVEHHILSRAVMLKLPY